MGVHVPQSFGALMRKRAHLRGYFVAHEMPAYWMTINPADLKCPLVLHFAGIELTQQGAGTNRTHAENMSVIMNPVAVAQFFDAVCKGVFSKLLQVDSQESGIFGKISNYFGVVESNGRGMPHLHALVWLKGNAEFYKLRERIENEPDFKTRMIDYLESVIRESISESMHKFQQNSKE